MKDLMPKIILSLLVLFLGACTAGNVAVNDRPQTQTVPEFEEEHIIKASYDAVDRILAEVESSRLQFDLSRHKPIIVTSLVDIDNLQRSSTLGRILGEQIGSRFAQSNYPIVEVKMRPDSLTIRPETGELILSRNMQDLSTQYDAQAVIAGTYAVAKDFVYVTLKVLRAQDGMIVYSYDFRLPMTGDVKKLVGDARRRR